MRGATATLADGIDRRGKRGHKTRNGLEVGWREDREGRGNSWWRGAMQRYRENGRERGPRAGK